VSIRPYRRGGKQVGWIVDLSDGRDPVTGERRRFTATVRGNKREAEKLEARLRYEAGHAPSAAARQPFALFVRDMWLPATSHLRRRTREGYVNKLKVHILPYLGHVAIGELSPYAVQRWLDGERKRGVSEHTMLHAFRILRAILRQAVRWQVIASDPTNAVRAPQVRRRILDLPDAKEARRIVDAFRGHPVEVAVVLAVGAGLRRSEIAGLDWADFDRDAGTVAVSRGMHQVGAEVYPEQTKTPKSRRTVSLPSWAAEVLRDRRGIGPMVPLPPDAIAWAYKQHLTYRYQTCGVRWIPLRDLRHTHATLLLEAGEDVAIVSRRLGHSTVEVTMQHYLHPHASADERAAKRLDDL
jgi:integrase